jgi:hypothetical protein
VRGALAIAAVAACTQALAQPTLPFVGAGLLTPTGLPSPAGVVPLRAIGGVDVPGSGQWGLVSDFLLDTVSGTGFGTFVFDRGADSLSGTLSTSFAVVASGVGFQMQYTATSGTGDLAGFTATGNSLVRLDTGFDGNAPYSYIEVGILNLSPIPEPSAGWLMLGGLALLARWRRR